MDAVLVLSGGMDSSVLLAHELSRGVRVAALSFDYGAKHNARELPLAGELCAASGVDHKVASLAFMDALFSSSLLRSGADIPDGAYDSASMHSTVVPFRNAVFLSIAVGYAQSIGAGRVLIASHSGDHYLYPDCRPEFNEAMALAARLGTDDAVRVEYPFARMDKREIGDLGRSLGVDFSRTWTCYKGGQTHCGVCGACDERKFALRHDEGLDPTVYADARENPA